MALAGVLILVAIIGGIFARSRHPSTATIDSRAIAASSLVTHCRVCLDEALAARQRPVSVSLPPAPPAVASSAARALASYCRVCADEALAARQRVVPASRSATTAIARIFNTRALAAQCRVCLDEALGGTPVDVGVAEPDLALPASVELLRRNGPR